MKNRNLKSATQAAVTHGCNSTLH